jgi:hypothetical protein
MYMQRSAGERARFLAFKRASCVRQARAQAYAFIDLADCGFPRTRALCYNVCVHLVLSGEDPGTAI